MLARLGPMSGTMPRRRTARLLRIVLVCILVGCFRGIRLPDSGAEVEHHSSSRYKWCWGGKWFKCSGSKPSFADATCDKNGRFDGQKYTKWQCSMLALTKDPTRASVWEDFGDAGGGMVRSVAYSAKQCYEKSLSIDPLRSSAWNALGVLGGGTVQGEAFDALACWK